MPPLQHIECSSCGRHAKRSAGVIALGVELSGQYELVHTVSFFCEEPCFPNPPERGRLHTLPVRDVDPFVQLEKTLPLYEWPREMLERFVHMLAAIESAPKADTVSIE